MKIPLDKYQVTLSTGCERGIAEYGACAVLAKDILQHGTIIFVL